jgi:uncharacterized membrane protein
MDWLIVFFRLVHIPAAIIWAGGAAFVTLYLEPTVAKLGPDGGKVMAEFMRRKMSVYLALAATLTVVGGVVLYVKDAGGVTLWLGTTTGVVFTVGAAAGIIAWALGASMVPRTIKQIMAIGQEMATAGGPPSAELTGRMDAAQERLKVVSRVSLAFVALAIVTMATARYFV